MFDFLSGLLPGAQGGGYFSGQPFSPPPAPGAPGAAPGATNGPGVSAMNMLGRVNNSINPISLLLGLLGQNPGNAMRPLWKSSMGSPGSAMPPGGGMMRGPAPEQSMDTMG